MIAWNKKQGASGDETALAVYLAEINKIPLLDRKEEANLARKAACGDRYARERILEANLRFVVSVAKRYQNHGLSLPDLISEGNVGLIKAIEKYDVERGYHFITYAVWWIKQAVLKAIYEKSRMIRLPYNRIGELSHINRARGDIEERKGTEATAEEIARELNMKPHEVLNLLNVSHNPVSLEAPAGSKTEASPLHEFIEDVKYEAPEDSAVGEMLKGAIERALRTLTKREADILRSRFGLGGKRPMTLREIGKQYNVTKERIRQIEKRAIGRLRDPSRSERLRSYVS